MDPSNELSAATPQEAAVCHNDTILGGLYEELKQEKAKFNAFMKSTSCALDGSVHSLYDRFEYIYQKRDELIEDPAEFEKFKTDKFFQCSNVKPKEQNLLRQLLYFFNDAKTKPKRDRWSKAATVLEHFRSQAVPHGHVARLLREGHGFVSIWRSIYSAEIEDDGVYSDHDVFATGLAGATGSAVGSINLGGGDLKDEVTQTHAPQGAAAVERGDASPEAQGREAREPSVAVAAAADRADDVVARGRESKHSKPPATLRDALKNNVLLRTLPWEMEIALTPGRVVLFAEVTAHDRWIDVQTVQVIHLDGEQSQWPRLNFSGQTSQRSAPDTSPSAIDAEAHEPERSTPHVSNSAVDAPPKQPYGPPVPTDTKRPMAVTLPPKSVSGANHANTAKAKDALSGRSGMRSADGKTAISTVIPVRQAKSGKTVMVIAKPATKDLRTAWSSMTNPPKLREAPTK
jgi:hypothetical protein